MYYTSGTTGRPKGVLLSHSVVSLHTAGVIAEMRLNRHDVWGHFAPMFHLVDAFAIYAITFVGGRHTIMRQWDTSKALLMIQRERVSVTNLASTMLTLMTSNPLFGLCDLSSLRILSAGGSPTPPEWTAACFKSGMLADVTTDSTTLLPHYCKMSESAPRNRVDSD